MARYECSICGYVYDEAQEGVAWESLPEDWACPGCGAGKNLFNLLDDGTAPVSQNVLATPMCHPLRSPGTPRLSLHLN